MSNETEFIAFLHEVIDLRVKDISERAQQQADINEVNQRLLNFTEDVTDKDTRAILLQYEALKNEQYSLLIPLMYSSGIKDLITLHRILLVHPLS